MIMKSVKSNTTLQEAADLFLDSVEKDELESSRAAVYHFIQWFGKGRDVSSISASEVDRYSRRTSSLETDSPEKLEYIRRFLSFLAKKGFTPANLAPHIKVKRPRASKSSPRQENILTITPEGREELERELEDLHQKRIEVTEEMRRAAQDKDFRENAPYHAAKEKLGLIVGRIEEIEATLAQAVVVETNGDKIDIGCQVVLKDMQTGAETCYEIVSAVEASGGNNRLSITSPVGKAIKGHSRGEVIEVEAPVGKRCYCICDIRKG